MRPGYRNLAELHRCQAARLGPLPAVAYRRLGLWHNLSWSDYRAEVLACATGLVECGIALGDRVGILSENRPEWLVADVGILAAGAVTVPPHAPLTSAQIRHQLADSGVVWLFVSDRKQLDKVRSIRHTLPDLRGIVTFETLQGADDVQSWEGFLSKGRRQQAERAAELERREAAVGADDLATLIYTSGTTGEPRGVMLTHGNLLSNALATLEASPFRPDDVALGWLPLTHIFARLVDHYATMAAGILLTMGTQETLLRDLREVLPCSLASVPRFYEKVLAGASSTDPDKTSRNLRHVFGSRMNHLLSGGAPLPPAVASAYQEAGLLLLQGYGLTETSPVITCNRQNRYKLSSVGTPLPGVEVRIAGDGEILTRGPHVMKGYWKNPEATAACLVDGWFHTGDLGHLDADGFLSITGRKKELMVLSNGKKVVPAYLEGLLKADPCIEDAVVCGEGRNYLTALLVAHWDNVRQALRDAGVEVPAGATDHPAVRDLLEERIRHCLVEVSPMEQIRKFVILAQPFSVEAEELTVSLKLRRSFVVRKYADVIDCLYANQDGEEDHHHDRAGSGIR